MEGLEPPQWPEYSVPLGEWFEWTPINRDAPIAYVTLVGKTFKQWKVLVCPFCGDSHVHGAGDLNEDPRRCLGGRVSHCWDERVETDEYRLVEWKGQELPVRKAIKRELTIATKRKRRGTIDLSVRESMTAEHRSAAWQKTNGLCWYCGIQTVPYETFQVDHVHPVARGGENDIANLVPCCKPCNSEKRAMPLERFRFTSKYAQENGGAFWFEKEGRS